MTSYIYIYKYMIYIIDMMYVIYIYIYIYIYNLHDIYDICDRYNIVLFEKILRLFYLDLVLIYFF